MKRAAAALAILLAAGGPAHAQRQDPDIAGYLQSAGPRDPVAARMTSKVRLTFGPLAKVVEVQDLPIVGKRLSAGETYYVVSFGPGGVRVLVNASGEVFGVPDGESPPMPRPANIKPKDVRIIPIPR